MVYKSKKAISPVVATALLLVVAVVAVVGFQTWFNNYQSGLNSKVEQESAAGSSITVERLEAHANASIYLKNTATSAVSIISWTVNNAETGANVCNGETTSVTDAASEDVTTYYGNETCDTALTVGEPYNVVVVTADGVFSAKLLAR